MPGRPRSFRPILREAWRAATAPLRAVNSPVQQRFIKKAPRLTRNENTSERTSLPRRADRYDAPNLGRASVPASPDLSVSSFNVCIRGRALPSWLFSHMFPRERLNMRNSHLFGSAPAVPELGLACRPVSASAPLSPAGAPQLDVTKTVKNGQKRTKGAKQSSWTVRARGARGRKLKSGKIR